MKKFPTFRLTQGVSLLSLIGLWGCATPAVVFISPNYNPQQVQRVSVQGFSDVPGQQGSGAMIADVFEKYLFNLHYQIVDPNQGKPDAVITGSVSELTNTSEQTVLVDIPQEITTPIYQDVVVQRRHGGLRTETQQVGSQTTIVDQSVPETQTMPARVGLSARLVNAKNGDLLWSGSGSADGMTISSAAEAASSKIVEAIQKAIENRKQSPTK